MLPKRSDRYSYNIADDLINIYVSFLFLSVRGEISDLRVG